MYPFVKRRTLHLWIALLAVLFSALAPSISHALAASSGPNMEICTTDGVQQVSEAGGKHDPFQHGMEHCPYCATHAASFALLPPGTSGLPVIGGHDLHPALFYHAPQPLFCWSAAHPRGPPAPV